jgi:soluble lytic murein transglycosylase
VLRLRVLVALCLATNEIAYAQSPTLLEAVRLRRPEARELAVTELVACQKASCDRLRELSLLVGFLTLAEGDAEAALAPLGARPAPTGLEPVHAYYLGQAYFYARRPGDAARQFEAALPAAPRWLEARLRARLGEALLAAGQPAQAAPHLDKAAMSAGTPELYFQRAQARKAVGNLEGYRADLRTLVLRFPTHDYGTRAFELLRSDKKNPLKLSLDERLHRARELLDGGQASLALDELKLLQREKLAKGPVPEARLGLLLASVFFAVGKEQEGTTQLDALMKKGPSAFAAEAGLTKARRALKARDNAEARNLMSKVAEKYPKEAATEDALFFVGWLSLQMGKYADAVAGFDAFEKRFSKSRKRDDVMWFKALSQARMNQYSAARRTLELLLRMFPRSLIVPQAQYWTARWGQQEGLSKEQIVRAYEQIMALSPGSFYALLSSERLRELGQQPPPLFDVRPKLPEGPVPEQLTMAAALARIGLFRDASEEISQRISAVRTSEQAVRLGAALQRLGEYGAAHQLAARYLWGQAYTSKDPGALALLYPRAYESTVLAAAEERQVDPFFIWAIMRRESAFRPDVHSGADARGLMQLIPPTGTSIARELALPIPEPADLFAPELNIRLAGWYLQALFKRFNHPVLCAAAYNAGPPAALKWIQDKGSLPIDVFVEEIPFRETRAYIKQVIADQHIYRQLYAPTEAPLRLSFAVPKPSRDGVSF